MRRLALVVLLVLGVVAGAWAALLALPDVPRSAAPVTASGTAGSSGVRVAGAGVLGVPVLGARRADIRDNWGDPRDNGLRAHHGTDIPAPAGTPVLAAASGVIEKLWTSAAGGTTAYVRSRDRAWTFYYAHLAAYAPGLHEGQAVSAGEPIGFVGDTGNAGAGNFHLHFGLTRTRPEEHWYEGTDVDPFPYLAGRPLPR